MRRRILIALLPLALGTGCSDAGPATGPVDPAPGDFELISADEVAAADLVSDLSDESRAVVREALQAARQEIHAIVERYRSGEIGREEARALVEAVHARLIDALSEILSEKQIERLLNPPPGHDRPDLDLTAEQVRRIRSLREDCREAVARVKEAVEDGEITAAEGRLRVRRIAWECRRRFCAILEPDQQAKVPFCRGPEDSARDG